MSLGRLNDASAEAIFKGLLATGHAEVISLFGDFLAAAGRHAEAEEIFLTALERDPDDENCLGWYGELLTALDRDQEAERYLRRAFEVASESPRTRFLLGRFLLQFPKRREEALHHLRLAASQGKLRASQLILEEDPEDPTQDNGSK